MCLDICNIQKAIDENSIDQESFNIVIDKGTLDCIACNEEMTVIQTAVSNVHLILENGGTYMMVSRCPPEMRIHLF